MGCVKCAGVCEELGGSWALLPAQREGRRALEKEPWWKGGVDEGWDG